MTGPHFIGAGSTSAGTLPSKRPRSLIRVSGPHVLSLAKTLTNEMGLGFSHYKTRHFPSLLLFRSTPKEKLSVISCSRRSHGIFLSLILDVFISISRCSFVVSPSKCVLFSLLLQVKYSREPDNSTKCKISDPLRFPYHDFI